MKVTGFIFRAKETQTDLGHYTYLPERLDTLEGDAIFSVAPGWSNDLYEFVAGEWEEPDPPAMPKSLDDRLRAIVTAINDGSLAVGANKSVEELEEIIRTHS